MKTPPPRDEAASLFLYVTCEVVDVVLDKGTTVIDVEAAIAIFSDATSLKVLQCCRKFVICKSEYCGQHVAAALDDYIRATYLSESAHKVGDASYRITCACYQ